MARRGFGGTALRAALGAATGVAEGLQQRELLAEKRRADQATTDRQRMMDTISLINAGYAPEGMSGDMPGATPRTPFDTQMVGDRKFTRFMSPSQMQHMENVDKERALIRAERLKASLKDQPKLPIRYTEGEGGINEYDPNTQRSTFRPYAKGFTPKSSDKGETSPNIGKIISGAGKIVAASRNEEQAAERQLAALDRSRPDITKFTGTEEQFTAAEAAWQKKVDAAEKRLETAQNKTARIAPTYEGSLISSDTTGFGEAFGTPTPAPTPAPRPTYNTREATLGQQARRKIEEIQMSDLTPEEKQDKVQQVNAILRQEIIKLRGGGQ